MALSVTLAGLLGLPLSHLRAMIADCPAFQAVTSAVDAIEAADFVSVGDADDTVTFPPRAVMRWPEESSIGRISNTSSQWGASIEVTFELPADPDYLDDYENAYATFCNQVGEIIREILQRAGRAGFLDVTGVRIGPMGQAAIEDNNGAEFFVCHLVVNFEGQP